MKDLLQKVMWFHETFKRHIGFDGPKLPDKGERQLRRKLLKEEYEEYELGEETNDLVEIADGLADMAYIIAGTAISYGIPLDKVLEEVQRAQLTKVPLGGKVWIREDGKVMKPPTYVAPDVARILAEAGWSLG